MTQYDEEQKIAALQQIGYQLENLNRNISKFGFTVLPTQDNSLCGHVNDCEHVATLRKIIEERNNTIDELRDKYNALREAWDKKGEKAPEIPLEKPYHKGMEVTTFGAK